ncbi:MAG: 3-hydroxyacyl-CoA dehydrogenase NAD-binding domain-containing protein [Pseudomonadota bacterium]
MSVVGIEKHDGTALIALNNPPLNAMSEALRTALVAAIAELDADDSISAIALYGAGRCFCAGADISEFGKPQSEPLPPDVTMAIEQSQTPIAVVMHGTTLGGGLEMGLAGHARVATPNAKLGLPEVGIGLLPGAGGCIRAPHLIGWEAAHTLITSGRPISADKALDIGLIDRIEEGAPKDIALSAAQDLRAGLLQPHKTSELPLAANPQLAEDWMAKVAANAPGLLAPKKAVEAITAATLPVDQAFACERALFAECMDGPQSQAFIHAFFAERAVWKIPEAKESPRQVRTLGIIGGGTMGSGIATSALLNGLPVTLVETSQEAADRAVATISANLAGAVKRGKLTSDARDDLLKTALMTATDLSALAEQDIIVEAVFEDMDVKQKIFKSLDTIAKPGAILATNTSCLDVNEIAATTARPQDVLGLHFFSPAHVMKLLEVVVGEQTAPEVVATGFALAKTLRKTPVRSGVCDGFIGNRILHRYLDAADQLVLQGATPQAVDKAMEEFGYALGPFAVNDLAGIDISFATRVGEGKTAPLVLERKMLAAGLLGRKTGAGYYTYDDGKKTANDAIEPMLSEARTEMGARQHAFSSSEIVERILTAIIAEATRVVEEGIALRPVDVDAVYLFGYGFPRFRGGPLHYADEIGAAALLERMQRYAADDDAAFWQPPALLQNLAQSGSDFAALNTRH